MKKTFIHILAILASVAALSSCEKFLDTVSYTERNTSNFPASEEDAMQLVTGIYSAMIGPITNSPGTNFYIMLANMCSDDAFGGGGSGDIAAQASDHFMTDHLERQKNMWTYDYQGIGRANMALANLDKVQDEALRNQLIGEALTMRTHFYFELAQVFEEVPLLTTVPQNVSEATDYPAAASVDEIYGFMAASLKKAIEIMPSTPFGSIMTGKNHVSKWVAEGLLARIYLFYTGFYSDKLGKSIDTLPLMDLETGEMTSETISRQYVIDKLNDCIQNSGFRLLEDYRMLWGYSNVYTQKDYAFVQDMVDKKLSWAKDGENPEQMFSICCAEVKNYYNQVALYNGLRMSKTPGPFVDIFPLTRGYGFAPVSTGLWNDWEAAEPDDIRRMGSIYNIYEESTNLSTYEYGADKQMEETGLWQKKVQAFACYLDGKWIFEFTSGTDYYGTGKDFGRKKCPTDITLMRFADILLMHSELTQTADGLNKVRARAGLPPVAYSTEALRNERRWEFAMEGLRWGDMRRYGKAYCIDALQKQLGHKIWNEGKETVMKDQGSGYKNRYETTWGFRPYPQSEVDLSNGVLTQKNGWDNSDALYTGWK